MSQSNEINLFDVAKLPKNGTAAKRANAPLDTLAQLPPDTAQAFDKKNLPTQKDSLKKRARAKVMTNAFAAKLAQRPTALKKSYLSSLACARMLQQHNNKIVGKYCNQRWCLVCNRIRTAKLMNGYLPVLAQLGNKYFLTLTVPNCEEKYLFKTVEQMHKQISLINRHIREKKSVKFKGLRKFECTYNLTENTFHPHFHIIIDSHEAGKLFLSEWLSRFPNAKKVAQDLRPADDDACKELFKYFTKVVVKTGKGSERKATGIHTPSLDAIFLAVRGMRTFQPLGIKKIKEDIEELNAVEDENLRAGNAIYEWLDNDWCDTSTGELLTEYVPSEAVKAIIDNII